MVGRIFKPCVAKKECKNERCKHTYSLDFTPAGAGAKGRCRMSTVRAFGQVAVTKTEAEVLLPKFIEEVTAAWKANRKPFEVQRQTVAEVQTFEDLVLKQYLLGKLELRTVDDIADANIRSHINQLIEEFRDGAGHSLPLSQLGGEPGFTRVATYKVKLKDRGLKASSYDRILATLRNILRWGHAHGYITTVPFGEHKVKLDTGQEMKRTRRLDGLFAPGPGEEADLLAAADKMNTAQFKFAGKKMRERLEFAVDLAARRKEMQRVQREDVQYVNTKQYPYGSVKFPGYKTMWVRNRKTHKLEQRYVRNTKNGHLREVPMSKRVRAIMDRYRFYKPEDFIFGDDGRYIAKFVVAWNTLNLMAHGYDHTRDKKHGRSTEQKALLQKVNLHWHDLRRECASRWLAKGVPLPMIQLLLGHSDIKTTQRYLHISDQDFAGACAGLVAAMMVDDQVANA